MTVGELKKLLRTAPNDALVVLASDEEGNSFRALYQVSKENMQSVERGEYELTDRPEMNAAVFWPA